MIAGVPFAEFRPTMTLPCLPPGYPLPRTAPRPFLFVLRPGFT